MALSIKSDEADQLARELANETGTSLTQAVTDAIRTRLTDIRRNRSDVLARLRGIAEAANRLPRIDGRDPDDIVGYDEHGLPS
jgi:antitoxin VapB